MIPKKIHYCWLSGEEMPDYIKKCMATWKRIMPDYELVLWDKNKFDINSVPYVSEACSVKKWAFAADYIRLYSVYTEGGIYMDSDVIVKKSFSELLDYDFIASIEMAYPTIFHKILKLVMPNRTEEYADKITNKPYYIQAAVFGGIKGHPFLKSCMGWYTDRHFIIPASGEYDMTVSPAIYAHVAQTYGFKYKNKFQKLDSNMAIFPSSVFRGRTGILTEDTYAIHYGVGGWQEKSLFYKLSDNIVLRKVLGKKTFDEMLNETV